VGNRILVGITTYNDFEHTEMLLQSIRWYSHLDEPYDLVVYDDGSQETHPETVERLRHVCSRFGAALIASPVNRGIPAGWNVLANAGNDSTEIVVWLNNDLLMPPNWLRCIVAFLDWNADIAEVGSVFLQPYQPVPKSIMRAILPYMGSLSFTPTHTVTGQALIHRPEDHGVLYMTAREGEGHGLGRVMCPCGCCFAARKEVYDEIGPFDERMTSFHEESDWGTRAAELGRASFALPYPKPYHVHGNTFAENPELHASRRMVESRKLYRKKWAVPDNVSDTEYFDFVNRRFMPKISEAKLSYLIPDYDAPPEIRKMSGGESIELPRLIGKTEYV